MDDSLRSLKVHHCLAFVRNCCSKQLFNYLVKIVNSSLMHVMTLNAHYMFEQIKVCVILKLIS